MRAVLISTLAILVGGCASFRDMDGNGLVTPHDLGVQLNGADLAIDPHLKTRFDAAYLSEREPGAVPNGALRRELVQVLIRDSNTKCEAYLVGLSGSRNSYDAGLNILSLALGTAGGLATPARSANILSNSATFMTGANQTLTDSIFGGKELPVLYAAVRNGRRLQREAIIQAMNAGDFDSWDYQSILTFMQAYDHDCGINYGLDQLSIAVEAAARQGAVARENVAAVGAGAPTEARGAILPTPSPIAPGETPAAPTVPGEVVRQQASPR